MDFILSGIVTLVFVVLFILYVYAFILLWKDEKFEDLVKILGTVLFLAFWPAAWVYLIYRMFRN